MHDSGAGGSAGSDWSSANVRQLWELVKEQETDAHWKLVAGWRQSAELTTAHLARVENYRNHLAAAWSPDQSPAAAAYLARLDEMIGNLRETSEAAIANYATFAAATGALGTSRSELKKLYDEFLANEKKIERYEQAKATAVLSASPTPTGTPSPSPGPSPVPTQPPVTPQEQEQLNWKARSLMYELSGTLIEARAQIKLPTPYKPPGDRTTEKEPEFGGGPPPPIPPITTLPRDERSGPPTRPPNNAPNTGGVIAGRPIPGYNGPSLVSTAPVITPPTPQMPPVLPGPTVSIPPVNTGIIGAPPTLTPPRLPSPGLGSATASSQGGTVPPSRLGNEVGNGLRKPVVGGVAGGPGRPMAPGGVIGHAPGVGLGQPGTRPISQRVNPIGGIIGNSAGGVANQQPGGFLPAGTRGQQPGSAIGQRGTFRTANRHLVDPWRTDDGVEPVVAPRREQSDRIDPGPAIGLNQ